MPLKATTIRWESKTYEFIRSEARDADITFSQFVREAAIIMAMIRNLEREKPGGPRDIAALAREVRRLASVDGDNEE